MAIKLSVAVKNGRLNAIETAIGVSAVLKIRTGAAPTAITDADTGTVLATLTLPSDWLAAASAGAISMTGSWADASADAAGTAGHFRIYASDGTTQHMQGSVAASAADMIVDNVVFAAAQAFSITSFTLTDGN